jgi:DNA-binding GntR family transcriptional regulator
VVEGALPPGSQLNEVELATTFGVSRGPVREALQRLIQEGLLLREPHRGVFVPVMTPEDVDDIYLVREAMETTAVRRLAGLSRTASASKALDRIVRAMETAERADDWNTVASRDLDFHSALVAAADSPRLERMFTTVISETRLCLGVLSAAYDTRDDLVEEHRRISDLIRQNDVDGAVAALKKHFDDGVVTLKRRLASRGGPQAG